MQRRKRESKSPRRDSLTRHGEIYIFFLHVPNTLPLKIDVICINDRNVKQLLVRRHSEIVCRHGEIVTLSGEICFLWHVPNTLP